MGPDRGEAPGVPAEGRRQIAFLRAVNVGGRTLKMDHLRALLREVGLTGVETFIASGNAAFLSDAEPAELERRIERKLREALGFDVDTFLRSAEEVGEIARSAPFPGEPAGGHTLYVAFLHGAPDEAAVQKLMTHRTPEDDFRVHRGEAYWLRRGKGSESRFSGAVLERALGVPATLRNVTTVRKLAEKYPV